MSTDDLYGWRARIEDDYLNGSVRLLLAQRAGDALIYVTQIGADGYGGMETERVEVNMTPTDPGRMRIPEDAARALYDALAAHFAGEAGGRQTRADLLHERGRVDKLIASLSAIAERP